MNYKTEIIHIDYSTVTNVLLITADLDVRCRKSYILNMYISRNNPKTCFVRLFRIEPRSVKNQRLTSSTDK